jgi:hypothetical protein
LVGLDRLDTLPKTSLSVKEEKNFLTRFSAASAKHRNLKPGSLKLKAFGKKEPEV